MRRPIRSAGVTTAAVFMMGFSWLCVPAAALAQGDACSLLSKEDAAAALGEAPTGPKLVGPMTDAAGSTVSSCEYTGSGYHRVQLIITRLPASSLPMYKAMICDKKGKEGLTGLGELACWYNDKHAELHVIKGSVFVSVELQRNGNPSEAMIGVMKKALTKLK